MAQFTKQFMTNGQFDYKKLMEHREQMQLDPLMEEPDNDQFTQEVKTAEKKSQGKGKKAEVAKPFVQSVKMETGTLPEKVQETMEVYDADAINGVSVETVTEEKKWIAGAIKKPGALHKQLGVPEGEKIPAEKLEKAAKAPGKMGQRARLAKTLKTLRKESLERIEEDELSPKQKKIAKIAGDPHKIDQHDLKALRSGHQMEEVELDEESEYLDEASHPLQKTIQTAKKLGYNVSNKKTKTGHSTTFYHPELKHRIHANTQRGEVNFMNHTNGVSGNEHKDAFHSTFKNYHHDVVADQEHQKRQERRAQMEEVELDEEIAGHKQFMATYKRNENQNRHMENVVHLAKHYGSPEELQTAKQHLEDGRKAGYNIHHKANHALHSKLWDRMHKLHSMKEEVELDEMVTRKHFQQVADVIKSHPDAEKRSELAKHHAEIFKKQNPRFHHKRFYAAANVPVHEEVEQIEERELTPAETKKKEEVVKSMKKKLPGFKERYGERAKEVMYATATKIAKKD